MAVTASGLFLPTWIDVLDSTQLAVDWTAATHKLALFSNSITPNFSSDTAYGVSPYNANEVSGTGWAAGGVALGSTTVAESPTGTIKFGAADISAATTTLTNARAALIYADALVGNNALILVDFTSSFSTVAGTFQIAWTSGTVWSWDLTP